jgi:transcription elongation factor Elf1
MPISQRRRFQCRECGYETTRTIGDKLPSINMFKPCPKCGGSMEMLSGKVSQAGSGTLEQILEGIGRIFGK